MVNDVDAFLATMLARSRLPSARAVALVRDCYGLETRAVRLTGERDENFKLSTADGAAYILKIANPAEQVVVSDLLTAALLHLAQTDPTLPCPRVVLARSGAAQVRFTDETGAERTARVLTYLPGELLSSSTRSPQQRSACGRIAGRLSRVLRTFSHPAARRVLIWDPRHVGHVSRLLDELPAITYRQAAAELLQRLVPDIEARLPRLRQQVVHNDLSPLNILVDRADPVRVAGIIDFGDLTHTALVADAAVIAAELLPDGCNPGDGSARQAVRDVASAYHESLPLLAEELALLGTLVAARLVSNVVVQEWHLHRNPAGEHYAALDPEFIRARLAIAKELLREEITL